MKNREQTISFIGVIILAAVLPGVLKLANGMVRYFVGAEGRLAAIAVETDHVLGPLPEVWKGLAQGGENLTSFLNNNETKVAAIEPRYIRIDHIYDQFGVVSRQGQSLVFNWSTLDKVVQQILATGAKPFFSLSYMPPELAVGGDVTAEPKNWTEWSLLVQKTIEHYSGEMAIEGVYYEVWNEPDLFGKWKIGGKKDYRTLYMYASQGAGKAAGVKDFKLGGPGTTGLYKNWVNNFLPYIQQNKLRMDFYSWHRYDLNIEQYTTDVQDVDRWLEGHPYFNHVEKVVTEMGPDSTAGGSNTTTMGAAHLVAVSRELMYKIKMGMSFSVTGGWGILDTPRHQAFQLLSVLGDQRLGVTGEGSWVRAIGAKSGNTFQVILTNFDPEGKHSEVVPVTFLNLKDRSFLLRQTYLGESTREQEVATSEAILQRQISMTPNSVVLLELAPKVAGAQSTESADFEDR